MCLVKKIVVIGPESTGKSTLCESLALHYRTRWVPEYAREYLLAHGTNYSFEDLLVIAREQVAAEDRIATETENHPKGVMPLFIDTDLYVMKVWCEYVFGKCHSWIIDQIALRRYDLYLLCRTDLPWTKDELREYPDLATREKLFHMYRDILVNQSTPWQEIGGIEKARLDSAITATDSLLG